jgi:sugar phosphate isomerase/epimerase
MPNIQLATSLFSFALEWNARQYTLETLLAETRRRGLGPGLEIIGFQSLPGFPHLSDAEVSAVRRLIDRYEFVPACLDANVDVRIRRDRMMNVDETVEYLLPQIQLGARLGFPVIRVQMTAKPEVLRRLVGPAEKAGVTLGMELHTPYDVFHPAVRQLMELYDEIDSPALGFIPDFGTSMRAIPDALLYSFREVGVTDAMTTITREIWRSEVPIPEKFGALRDRIGALGGTPAQIGRLNMAFSMNGRQPVESWRDVVPRTVHLHGKFYGFDAAGDEPAIDYAGILRVFHEGGFRGYVASEYEGTAFTDAYTGFEMVEKHHALCRRILEDLDRR